MSDGRRSSACGTGGDCACPASRRKHLLGADELPQLRALNSGTLDRMLGSPHAMLRKVGLPAAELGINLVQFGSATATTRNTVFGIHQLGNYDLASTCGAPLRTPGTWISLRLREDRIGSLVVVGDGDTGKEMTPSLYVYGAAGALAHRVLVHSAEDAALLTGIGRRRAPGTDLALATPGQEPGDWRDRDQLSQLDAVLEDGGVGRRAELLATGTSARRIDSSVIAMFFERLCTVGLAVSIGVYSEAVLQLCAGRVHLVERVGSTLVTSIAESIVEIDLRRLTECVLVTTEGPHGRTTALEFYAEDGRCVAVATQLGIVGPRAHASWERMLASLPEPSPV